MPVVVVGAVVKEMKAKTQTSNEKKTGKGMIVGCLIQTYFFDE